ncbi:adenine deaminase C-terminal domain-containing protein [Wukongibacter sp. M2B1]|uniref:adenine deaminase C-terminal domain-containing protein n=1 Tax=Wukongibacter sp. M2B1 TaxID=3088895 RepID=UPI003D7A7C58
MKVDLVIKNAWVYNSYFKRFMEEDVAILEGTIIYVGKEDIDEFSGETIIDARGKYLIPGLIDIHMHIESSMATPQAFSHELIRNGVTTIVSEPHEIANVFGVKGILEMIRNGEECVADIFYGVPSSVPSTSLEFETTGFEINIDEIKELMKNDKIICLGEVMNYYDVIHHPRSKTNKIIEYMKKNYPDIPIEGHCPKIMGKDLASFIYRGIDSDHTQQKVSSMEERIKRGMFIEIQEKSMTSEVIDYLIENRPFEHFCFVTDDVMADSFYNNGHLNRLVKRAIKMGMKPEDAIYASTFTPARRMRLKNRGAIAPGKLGDFVLLKELKNFEIDQVYKEGKLVYDKEDEYKYACKYDSFPREFYTSIKRKPIDEDDLVIKAPFEKGEVNCRIIKVSDGTTFTEEQIGSVAVKQGKLMWEETSLCMIAVFERYGRNGNIGLGLITGDTIKRGAIATSYAHDHHNILAVGKTVRDIVKAVNNVIQKQGGIYVVCDGDIKGGIDLPVGGILSEKSIEVIGRDIAKVRSSMEELGYKHYNPIMSLCTNGLPVSQLLKITDKGLVKLSENRLVDLIVEG